MLPHPILRGHVLVRYMDSSYENENGVGKHDKTPPPLPPSAPGRAWAPRSWSSPPRSTSPPAPARRPSPSQGSKGPPPRRPRPPSAPPSCRGGRRRPPTGPAPPPARSAASVFTQSAHFVVRHSEKYGLDTTSPRFTTLMGDGKRRSPAPRAAACLVHAARQKVRIFFQPCVVLVSQPRAAVRFRAGACVFIFVRNFSRGIFLRESLSTVVEVLTLKLRLL